MNGPRLAPFHGPLAPSRTTMAMTLSEVETTPHRAQASVRLHVNSSPIKRAAKVAAPVAVIAALTLLFYFMSTRTFIPDSDSATAVLEGQSMAGGHLTLHGWALSLDSFWSVDAVFYMVAVAIIGVRSALLHLVPAFIAAVVVVIGMRIARDGRRGAPGIAAAITVLALLGLPDSYLCLFFLRGVAHIGTTLWCLVAFFALRRRHLGVGWWFVAVAFLAAGLLGDFQMIALGVTPVLLAGITAILRTRSWRAGFPLVAAALASILLAVVVRGLAVLVGTFSVGGVQASANAHQILANFRNLVSGSAHMFGIEPAVGVMPTALRVGRYVGLLLVVSALVVFAAKLIIGIVRGNAAANLGARRAERLKEAWRLDDLLLFGCIGGVVVFDKLATANDFTYDRYLTSAVIFGCILAGRFVGRLVSAVGSPRILWSIAAVGLAVIGVFSFGVEKTLASPDVIEPASQLGHFLESHQLHSGIGDYWSASITTVQTDGAVIVRPVITNGAGKIVRYGRQSSASWYAGHAFEFLVYDTAALFGVNTQLAAETFGKPAQTYVVGIYRVLIWTHPVYVSPVGFDPNSK